MKKHGSMNHTFRLVWSDVQNAFVAVSEHVKGKGKKSNKSIAASSLMAVLGFTAAGALAGPELNQITAGEATVTVNGGVTDILQSTEQLRADWNNFNIEVNETVNFIQPGETSLAVNNILDTNGTRIMGNLNANGQVWLINPNGVLFGQNAKVDVGSILASTLNPMDNITTDGKQVFGNGGTGSIINQGSINAEAGYVAFIGNKVSNQGDIKANNGAVALGAGSQVTVEFAGSNLLSLTVDQSTLDNLAENKQLIQANGGMVLMSAGARDSLIASVVNNEGKIEAKTVQHKDGKIILMGGMAAGTTKVAGTLDASAETGDGGFIETSAANVEISDDAHVTTKADNGETGEWLIDPTDFYIHLGASGGNKISTFKLAFLLQLSNIKMETTNSNGNGSGDIHVNAPLKWTSGNTLTLESRFGSGGININHNITFTNGGLKLDATGTITAAGAISGKTFDLKSGTWQQVGANLANFDVSDFRVSNFDGGTFIRAKGGNGTSAAPYQLTDVFGLQGVGSAGMLDKHYTLVNDIDASGTSTWNSNEGFAPLGNGSSKFTGKFDGLGHMVNDLTINRPFERSVGLFGYISKATIKNIGMVGGSVKGTDHVGGLAGQSWDSTISNAYATESVTGDDKVGGLVGSNYRSTINNAYATGSVTGHDLVGGLVGLNKTSTISNAYATGSVTGHDLVGGLVGSNSGTISNAYATGSVTGEEYVGGLVATNRGTITNAYATGAVHGDLYVSGLVSDNYGTITNTYAAGAVSGSYRGGLVVTNNGTITNSFFNTQTSNIDFAHGKGKGKTTAQMQQLATFTAAAWDIDGEGGTGKTWRIYEGHTSPLLRSFMTTLDLSADQTVNYNGNAQTYALPAGTDSNKVLGTVASGINAATYQNDLYSGQQGYDIKGHDSNLIIDKLAIDLTALARAEDKTYDGTLNAVAKVYSNDIVNGDIVTFSFGSALFSNADAGQNKTVTVSGISTGGAHAANYDLQNTTATTTADINKKAATVTANSDTVTYNGQQQSVTGFTVSGLVNGEGASVLDDVQLAGGEGKNAGTYQHTVSTAVDNNYDLTTVNGQLNINKKDATVIANSDTVTYNGEQQSVTGFTVSGLVGGEDKSVLDNVQLAGGEGRNADTYDHVVSTASDNNYNLTKQNGVLTIDKKAITVDAIADNKTYDGNKEATVELNGQGVITGDAISFSGNARFKNKHAGLNKKVTVNNISATGIDADNYTFNQKATDRATISKLGVDLTVVADNKVYDGNKTAMVSTLESAGILSGDQVSFSHSTAMFEDKNVGVDKKVSVEGISATGRDARNYAFNEVVEVEADITAKNITVDALAYDKIYDATRRAEADLSSQGLIQGDDVSFTGRARFNNKNVGLNKKVTVRNISASGDDAGNYSFNQKATDRASIRALAIDVEARAYDKTYDGNRHADADLFSNGILGNDKVWFDGVAKFGTKHARNNKTVTVRNITATGQDARNYVLIDNTATDKANITKLAIDVTATASDKVYDGNKTAMITALESAGIIAGDDMQFNVDAATGMFDHKNVGEDKTVYVNNITASGSDARNYEFLDHTTTTADVTPKHLHVRAFAEDKVYDATTDATFDFAWVDGFVPTDEAWMSFTRSTATFDNKNVGQGKTVTFTGMDTHGADAGNYTFDPVVTSTADITPKHLHVRAFAHDKVYDGNTDATFDFAWVDGFVPKDEAWMSFTRSTATFDNKNVGQGKTVTFTGMDTHGADASNYTFDPVVTSSANVTPKHLHVRAFAHDKMYDGNNGATFDFAWVDGFVPTDEAWMSFTRSTATFDNKNVGQGKTVTFTGMDTHGADAGNYTFDPMVTSTADVMAQPVKAINPAPAVAAPVAQNAVVEVPVAKDTTPAPAVKVVETMMVEKPAHAQTAAPVAEVATPKENVANPNVNALMQAATKVNGANVNGRVTLTKGEDEQEVK